MNHPVSPRKSTSVPRVQSFDSKRQSAAVSPSWRKRDSVAAATGTPQQSRKPVRYSSNGTTPVAPQCSPSPRQKKLVFSPVDQRGHRHARSSLAGSSAPPLRPPMMDSPLSSSRKGLSPRGVSRKSFQVPSSPTPAPPPPPIAGRRSLSLSPLMVPKEKQIKKATAPAPPQTAMERLSVKLKTGRKEKKAEKKERAERMLQ